VAQSVLHLAADISRREQRLVGSAQGGVLRESSMPDKLLAIEASVAVLTACGVSYALIGGLAVGIRSGVPRATLDVNFAVGSAEDLAALRQGFERAGFSYRGTHPHSLNFQHSSGEPVQLAFDAGFDPMIQRAELMRFGALEVRVVSTEDLVAMKRRAASDPARRKSKALRDLADVELLLGDVPHPDDGW
jgi:hypothetical protein